MTINLTSNNNDANNTINLLPLHISSNAISPNDMIGNKNASWKKDNKIFLLNLNLDINTNNKDDANNFFVGSKGNNFYNPFSKFKSWRNTNDKKLYLNNHKFFKTNINYYLSKKIPFPLEELKNKKFL